MVLLVYAVGLVLVYAIVAYITKWQNTPRKSIYEKMEENVRNDN